MDIKKDLQRRIEKENKKIIALQKQIEKANNFIQGLQEALRIVSGDSNISDAIKSEFYFRSGSTKDAYNTLKRAGRPMTIDELLTALGKPTDRQNRASLGSSLHRAVKRSGVIKSLGNNTFSLTDGTSEIIEDDIDLPSDFGGEEIDPEDIPF